MAVRPEYFLLSGRLLRTRGVSQILPDPSVHGVEGRIDRGDLHAHGLGATDSGLCHSGPAGSRAGVYRHHGAGVELYGTHTDPLLRSRLMRIEHPPFA